ncbi:MAG: threonine-phosphate decarboxylase CobD [Thermodesulfobacteriota bacterium]
MHDISTNPQGAHGGDIISMARSLGCAVSDLIDLSSNLTPLPSPPGLREALVAGLDQMAFLPESDSDSLVAAFAGRHGLGRGQVLAGNGTTEFIYAVPTATACKRALIVTPTYGDYRLACEWAGLAIEYYHLEPAAGFALDCDQLAARLQGGELVFICNPNNPTGGVTPSRELLRLAQAHPDSEFLVDESYLPFVNEESLASMNLPPNLLVLSSFSKIYGIPGLRLGFLVGAADRLATLMTRRRPWGVNRLAQLAGEYLLAHADPYVAEVQEFIRLNRPRFAAGLASLPGVTVVPGAANFILCRLDDGPLTAATLRERMLSHRIMIRDCANFVGLDDHYFRVSLKDETRNQQCLAALVQALQE